MASKKGHHRQVVPATCIQSQQTSADCIDAATAVALGAQTLEHVNAIHTLGLGAAALNPSTLVHV